MGEKIMTIQEVFDKYKHLEGVFVDFNLSDGFKGKIMCDMWKAIRAAQCKHPGCKLHVSHPCEGCGRQWGVETNHSEKG